VSVVVQQPPVKHEAKNEGLCLVARTPRTLSRRGHAEAKAGENIGQGKSHEDVTEKAMQTNQREAISEGLTDSEFGPLCGSAYVAPLAQQQLSRLKAA